MATAQQDFRSLSDELLRDTFPKGIEEATHGDLTNLLARIHGSLVTKHVLLKQAVKGELERRHVLDLAAAGSAA
jgi:hypothetical protein